MEANEKIISLNFNRKDFEEIYFRNNQGNFILSPMLKRNFKIFITSLLILAGTIIYSWLTNKNAWFIVIFIIITIITFISYCAKVVQLKKWRNSVMEFIMTNEVFKQNKLILTENTLSLVQDDKEVISKWSAFTNAEITDNYLTLTGNIQYFFPKKSMLPNDYVYLIGKIKSHLKTTCNK